MHLKLNIVEARRQGLAIDLEAVTDLIVRTQRPDGDIPWSPGDKTDPWDLVEAAMGLNVGGRTDRARAALRWLAARQLEDGSWYASYREGRPEDRTRDTNVSSYIAVGVFHDFLITGDRTFLSEMWPTLEKAVNFAAGFQAPGGEIYWAASPEGVVDKMALLTGSSSVYLSLKCALAAARALGVERPAWREARETLGEAIRQRPYSFNMTKSRYSMDWFYPILAGAVTGAEAQRRVLRHWHKFVVRGQGVLCVADAPWVTLAETSELVLALSAMGNHSLAKIVFSWIQDRVYEDGSYWAGFTVPEIVIWPEDRITWTNAVMLLAADALYGLTPAGRLFSHRFWEFYGAGAVP
ncbi:MAG: phenyltransferase domain-containing protein [Thermodesulfobacteriota bacterium]